MKNMHTNWGCWVRKRSSMFHDKIGVMSMHEANTMKVWRDGFPNRWESLNLVKDEKIYSRKKCYDKDASQDDQRSILKNFKVWVYVQPWSLGNLL
jgi:hypothetical protein